MSNGNLYPLGTKRWLFVTSDVAATVFASGYFNDLAGVLEVYDILEIQCVLNSQTVFYSTSVDADTNTSCSVRLPAQLATTESSLAASLAALESRVATLEANTGSGTIQYPGIISFQSTTRAVNEQSVVYIVLTRTSGSDGVVTADLSYTGGTLTKDTDYTTDLEPGVAAVSFAEGEINKIIALTIGNIAADGTIVLTMSNVSPAASAGQVLQCTVNVTAAVVASPGTLQLTTSATSVTEPSSGTTTVTISAVRSGGSSGTVAVAGSITPLSAVAGVDYTDKTLNFAWADGDTAAKTDTVTILSNAESTSDTQFRVSLGTPSGGASLGSPSAVTVTINNVHSSSGNGYTPNKYVTTTAAGGGDGTLGNPWTMAEAVAQAVAGDIVRVSPGTYSINRTSTDNTPAFHPTNSGTLADPIIFYAEYPAATNSANRSSLLHTGGIGYSTSGAGPVIGAISRDYIVWDGFLIDETQFYTKSDNGPVYIGGCTGVQIINCDIRGQTAGIWSGDNHCGIRIGEAGFLTQDTTIKNNKISNFYSFGTSTHNGAGIMTYGCRGTLVEHNEVWNCGAGIYFKGEGSYQQGDNTIRFNYVHDTDEGGIRTDFSNLVAGPVYTDVYQNLVVDAGDMAFNVFAAQNVRIVNNTIIRAAGRGVAIDTPGPSETVAGLVWGNNIIHTLVNAGAEMVNGGDYSSDLTTFFSEFSGDRNCYYDGGTEPRFSGPATGYSNFAAWQAAASPDEANSITSDPSFTNYAGNDFTLAGGSPCLGTGYDFLNLAGGGVGGAVNMGCYVTGSETIGVE